MNRNHKSLDVLIRDGAIESRESLAQWAAVRETHIAVATAIHSLAHQYERTAEQVWEAPDRGEWSWVCTCVAEYLDQGDFPREPDGRYPWGAETIVLNG